MADVKLISRDQDFLLNYRLGDIESDDGLETAIMVSLFTDQRVKEDELPTGENDRRGWWGDIAIENEQDQIGSKLWLLDRGKADESSRALAKQYAEESLQWLLDDGVADEINVTAVLVPRSRIDLSIEVIPPRNRDKYFYRYQLLWENQYMNVRKV